LQHGFHDANDKGHKLYQGTYEQREELRTLPKVASADLGNPSLESKNSQAQLTMVPAVLPENTEVKVITDVTIQKAQDSCQEDWSAEATNEDDYELLNQLLRRSDDIRLSYNEARAKDLSRSRFRSAQEARDYYRQFQVVIDNILKMRRSLLLSPAQKTANLLDKRGEGLEVEHAMSA